MQSLTDRIRSSYEYMNYLRVVQAVAGTRSPSELDPYQPILLKLKLLAGLK
jgi:hypothetical protein